MLKAVSDNLRVRVDFDHPSELQEWRPENEFREVQLIERLVHETPERVPERCIDITPILQALPTLERLSIESHAWLEPLVHPSLDTLHLSGAVVMAELRLPNLSSLTLEASGDAHGVALAFKKFEPLLTGAGTPNLRWLDLRQLDVECHKPRTTFVGRWAESALLPTLKVLGLPHVVEVKLLRKHKAAFAHLKTLVVSGLLSAFEKNPVGGNVYFEDEFPDARMDEIPALIASLPKPSDLDPKSDDDSFRATVQRLEVHRFEATALRSAITKFVTKRQWSRVETLLFGFAKKSARTKRQYMDLREALEKKVRASVAKKPDDPGALRVLKRIEEENRI